MSLSDSNRKTVLVTGINGYIASVLGLQILSKGYKLRGTCRSKDRVAVLLEGVYKDYASRVEIFEVEDITEPGAFDEAVRGVYSIHHTASPMDFSVHDWNAWVRPADESCTVLLKSAIKYAGAQLESFIFLSSSVVLQDPRHPLLNPRTGIEWHDWVDETSEKSPPEAVPNILYQASKNLAEKVVWDFRRAYKPSFYVISINPNLVIGPPVEIELGLNATLRPIIEMLSGSGTSALPNFGTHGFVDVRDVARTQIWCMEHPSQSDDKRVHVGAGTEPPRSVIDILRQAYPARQDAIPREEPSQFHVPDIVLETEKAFRNGVQASILVGFKYISFRQSILETAKVLERYFEDD